MCTVCNDLLVQSSKHLEQTTDTSDASAGRSSNRARSSHHWLLHQGGAWTKLPCSRPQWWDMPYMLVRIRSQRDPQMYTWLPTLLPCSMYRWVADDECNLPSLSRFTSSSSPRPNKLKNKSSTLHWAIGPIVLLEFSMKGIHPRILKNLKLQLQLL